MEVFGKPDRAINCDCERVNQPTLLQSVFLQNDPLVDQRLQDSGWLQEIADGEAAGESFDSDQLVRTAWLRALGRPPTPEEAGRAVSHLRAAPSVHAGMNDLMWALLNTKEFILLR